MSRTATMMPGAVAPGVGIERIGEVPSALSMGAEIAGSETALAHAVQAGPGAAVDAMEGSAGGGIIRAVADKLSGTGVGRKILGTAAGLMSAGAMVGPAVASAESGGSNTTIVDSQTGVTTRGSHAWQKDGDHSQVTVMGNHRTFSKAEVKQMEANGDCRWFNGKKVNIHTEGHATSGTAFGKDERKSLFCRTDQDFNGDGKADWVRALCGNAAIIGVTPAGAIEEVLWLGANGKFRVHADSEATAKANCSTTDGLATAEAYGHGEASANGFVKLHGGIKMRVEQAQGAVDATIEESLSGKAGAKSKAFAIADTQCTESGTPGTPGTPNNAPNVEVDNPNHIGASDTIAFCERESDSDGTIVDREFNIVQGGGNFTSNVYPGNDPGEFCKDYTARSTAAGPDVILSAEVTDNDSAHDTAQSAPFPVVDIPK